MQRQSLVLLGLFLATCGWLLWPRWPVTLADRHVPSPISPQPTSVQIEADWPTYTHPTWGISFRYHPGWTVRIPDLVTQEQNHEEEAELGAPYSGLTPEQIDYARTVGHVISLFPPQDAEWGNVKIEIVLPNYTLSPRGSLESWVTLINEREQSHYTLELLTLDQDYMPATADQALYAIRTDEGIRSHAIWLSRLGLVYGIIVYGDEPGVIELATQISASLKFDTAKQRRLRESANFVGDEEDMRQFNESMLPPAQQTPAASPLPTATSATFNSPLAVTPQPNQNWP